MIEDRFLFYRVRRPTLTNEEMTAEQFREMALSFPEAVEAAHMGHPDFRVGGKIFATLGYPNEGRGVLLLSPDEQQALVSRYPETGA